MENVLKLYSKLRQICGDTVGQKFCSGRRLDCDAHVSRISTCSIKWNEYGICNMHNRKTWLNSRRCTINEIVRIDITYVFRLICRLRRCVRQSQIFIDLFDYISLTLEQL